MPHIMPLLEESSSLFEETLSEASSSCRAESILLVGAISLITVCDL